MVLHNLGRGSQNYYQFWEEWEHSEFPDTLKASQGQLCKQVFHRRAVRSAVLIYFAHTHPPSVQGALILHHSPVFSH